MSTAFLSRCRRVLTLVAWLWWTTAPPAFPGQAPVEQTDQPERLVSLVDDAGLNGRNIFTLAFRATPDGAGVETVWLATSDGLRACPAQARGRGVRAYTP